MTNKTNRTAERRNDLTELVFILDKSGSMSGMEADTVGGFNSMIKKQKKEEGSALVSAVLFNQESEVLLDRVSLDRVRELTTDDYTPMGCTALLDAVGDAVKHIANIHKYARPEDVPSKTVFVITTDGMENSSRKFTYEKLKKLIQKEQEKYGWEFIFLGANIDAAATASSIGIRKERASNYTNDSMGASVMYEAVSDAVSSFRSCQPLSASCNAKVEKDSERSGFFRRKR